MVYKLYGNLFGYKVCKGWVMNEFKAWDWKRIFIGEAPPEFLVEVFLRTVIVFMILMVTVRLLGKRMSGQISIVELAVMVTLGAIISPGMQLPDRAILYVPLALAVILLLHKLVNTYAAKNERFEKLVEGSMGCLVKNGILQLDEMKRAGITRQELFARLRKKNVENLSSIHRAYIEACGIVTVFRNEENRPGLLIFPEKDTEIIKHKKHVDHGVKACGNCGNVQQTNLREDCTCKICKQSDWIEAYA
jgi:uncharacterized membrane protein YcaP (DUF421 family)